MRAKQAVERLLDMARHVAAPVKVQLPTGTCGAASCSGYHPVEALVAYPDGRLEHWPSPYGIHNRVYPAPLVRRVGRIEAEKLAARMLRRARRALRHPCLSWTEVLQTAVEVGMG
jgi:hypothetical protein